MGAPLPCRLQRGVRRHWALADRTPQEFRAHWHDGLGLSLYAKRLERGRFVWPSASGGSVAISAAQLAYMLDGIDWVRRVELVGDRGCKSLAMKE